MLNGGGGTRGGCSTPPAMAGYPVITVPMGAVHGMPVGFSFIGTAWSDAKLLRLAYAFEQATNARIVPGFTPAERDATGSSRTVPSTFDLRSAPSRQVACYNAVCTHIRHRRRRIHGRPTRQVAAWLSGRRRTSDWLSARARNDELAPEIADIPGETKTI
ncbi:MAG: hypothetical protein R2845_01850 [Thermomicrobiales bacterium]